MTKILITLIAIMAILSLGTGCSPATVAVPNIQVPTNSADQGYPSAALTPTSQPGYPAPDNSQIYDPYPAPEGSGLQIVTNIGQVNTVSLADLNALPKVSVDNESGPKISDIIKRGGIPEYTALVFTGSNGSITLTKDKITDQVILSLANNTNTLVVSGTPKEQWIKDVSRIVAK